MGELARVPHYPENSVFGWPSPPYLIFHDQVGLKCARAREQQRELLLQRKRRVKLKLDTYLIRGSEGAYALFLPIRRRIKKKEGERSRRTGQESKASFRPSPSRPAKYLAVEASPAISKRLFSGGNTTTRKLDRLSGEMAADVIFLPETL